MRGSDDEKEREAAAEISPPATEFPGQAQLGTSIHHQRYPQAHAQCTIQRVISDTGKGRGHSVELLGHRVLSDIQRRIHTDYPEIFTGRGNRVPRILA